MMLGICPYFKYAMSRIIFIGCWPSRPREHRSLAQQVLAVLARGLQVELDAKARRQKLIGEIRASQHPRAGKLSDPVKSIRQDRRR